MEALEDPTNKAALGLKATDLLATVSLVDLAKVDQARANREVRAREVLASRGAHLATSREATKEDGHRGMT